MFLGIPERSMSTFDLHKHHQTKFEDIPCGVGVGLKLSSNFLEHSETFKTLPEWRMSHSGAREEGTRQELVRGRLPAQEHLKVREYSTSTFEAFV